MPIERTRGRPRKWKSETERIRAYRKRKYREAHPHPLGSGDAEWYTPGSLVELVRTVLGDIDLDPASCPRANETVRAAEYLSHDGEVVTWPAASRVFCNPPYGSKDINAFSARCAEHDGPTILLCNAVTDTRWFQAAFKSADAVCFLAGRVKFYSPTGRENKSTNTRGQAVIAWRIDVPLFQQTFETYGIVT